MRAKTVVGLLTALSIVVFALATGQETPKLERTSDARRLNDLVRPSREVLMVGSNWPWAGLDAVLAENLRTGRVRLRVLVSQAEVGRWREWVRLGAEVRGRPGIKARLSVLVTPDAVFAPDTVRGGTVILRQPEAVSALEERLEVAWRSARP